MLDGDNFKIDNVACSKDVSCEQDIFDVNRYLKIKNITLQPTQTSLQKLSHCKDANPIHSCSITTQDCCSAYYRHEVPHKIGNGDIMCSVPIF